MNVTLIPFLLAARVTVDDTWGHGFEYAFYAQLNATPIERGVPGASARLDIGANLLCQPKWRDTLSCRFAESSVTFVSGPPGSSGSTAPVTIPDAIDRDQFEVKFDDRGAERLIVNENLRPRELDVLRAVIGQMSIGARLNVEQSGEGSLEVEEKFVRGECETRIKIERRNVGREAYFKRGFEIQSEFGVRDGQMIEIRKIRNLEKCTRKLPYYFGVTESFDGVSDVELDIHSSDARMIISATEFTSSTSNLITINSESRRYKSMFHEHIVVRLKSIRAARNHPPPVPYAKSVDMFVRDWAADTSEEESN